jgi:dipeptidase D
MIIISNFKRKIMTAIENLNPYLIWKYFAEILQIPRPSKKEEKIIEYLIGFAKEQKLEYQKDNIGNVVILKPATAGYENRKSVVLQSHVDMVCEKNTDTIHNFETDPIEAYIDNGWVKAKGTTLGADNGIGIAAQLALLADSSLQHGAIECLFTVDEETGLTGAFNIGKDFFKSKILINLDSEDDGELFIGCAGGLDTIIKMPYEIKKVSNPGIAYAVSVKNLIGGHSGDDINKGRGNSNKILIRFLWEASKILRYELYDFQGGNLRNAIPREARANIIVLNSDNEKFLQFFKEYESKLIKEIKAAEPNITFQKEKASVSDSVMTEKSLNIFLNALHACPNGVIEMSMKIPGLVQTSTNLASVKFIGDYTIEIVTSQRSSLASAKMDIANRIKALFSLAEGEVIHTDGYPGWKPNTNSEILNITKTSYQKLFKKEPIARAIHAGLECGLFLEKYPDLDMISFGPTIKEAHSPDEKLEISTVEKFWDLLLEVLDNIPEN